MKRGFTLIELAIVLGIMTVLTAPMLTYVFKLKLDSAKLRKISDLRTEARSAAEKIFQHAENGFRIEADNAGLTFTDGTRVFLKEKTLYLGERKLMPQTVSSFIVIRRGKNLTMNLTLEREPDRPGEPSVLYRNIYDFEVTP